MFHSMNELPPLKSIKLISFGGFFMPKCCLMKTEKFNNNITINIIMVSIRDSGIH